MLTTLLGKGTEGTGLWQLITGNTAFLPSLTHAGGSQTRFTFQKSLHGGNREMLKSS
jgi:hypothetical protein